MCKKQQISECWSYFLGVSMLADPSLIRELPGTTDDWLMAAIVSSKWLIWWCAYFQVCIWETSKSPPTFIVEYKSSPDSHRHYGEQIMSEFSSFQFWVNTSFKSCPVNVNRRPWQLKMHPGSPRRQSVGVPLPTQFGSEQSLKLKTVQRRRRRSSSWVLLSPESCLPVPGFLILQRLWLTNVLGLRTCTVSKL